MIASQGTQYGYFDGQWTRSHQLQQVGIRIENIHYHQTKIQRIAPLVLSCCTFSVVALVSNETQVQKRANLTTVVRSRIEMRPCQPRTPRKRVATVQR